MSITINNNFIKELSKGDANRGFLYVITIIIFFWLKSVFAYYVCLLHRL